jgi:hypothetical protein
MTKEDWFWVAVKAIGVWLLVNSAVSVAQTMILVIGNDLTFGRFVVQLLTMAVVPGTVGWYLVRDGAMVLQLLPKGGSGRTG